MSEGPPPNRPSLATELQEAASTGRKPCVGTRRLADDKCKSGSRLRRCPAMSSQQTFTRSCLAGICAAASETALSITGGVVKASLRRKIAATWAQGPQPVMVLVAPWTFIGYMGVPRLQPLFSVLKRNVPPLGRRTAAFKLPHVGDVGDVAVALCSVSRMRCSAAVLPMPGLSFYLKSGPQAAWQIFLSFVLHRPEA